jgi:hypothetical protein
MSVIIRKNYTNIFDELRSTYGNARIYFECLSETNRASASLCIEHAKPHDDDSDKLQITFGQNSVSGSSIADMRERVRIYEQAIEYGELLKARLKDGGFTFVCDDEE